jgi:hypothetical protein
MSRFAFKNHRFAALQIKQNFEFVFLWTVRAYFLEEYNIAPQTSRLNLSFAMAQSKVALPRR